MKWLVAIASCFFLLPALAADIYIERGHVVNINGQIKQGDAERVASLIGKLKSVSIFRVQSLGGNVDEAIKIASLIEGAQANFMINKGELCASACFFMYIAGHYRYATPFQGADNTNPSPEMLARGYRYVGIHRPYLGSEKEVRALSADKQERLMQDIRAYLQKKQVPQYLVDEMMGRSSNRIYWLREKDLDLLGDFSPGVEEILIKECGYDKVSGASWSRERNDEFNNCWLDMREREFTPLQQRFLGRLATGWRPWGKQ